MTDQLDPAQPPEGQGGGESQAPYAEYLERVPETVRGDIEPIFKEWDGNVTRRFQEASEYRKSWEPYENLGVKKLSADEVRSLIEFRDALQEPPVIQEWYEKVYAPQHGIQIPQAPEPAPQLDPFGAPVEPDITQLLEQKLTGALSPLQRQIEQMTAWQQQQQQQAREQEARRHIDGQLADLRTQHPKEFTKDVETWVETFSNKYLETDPYNAIPRAWSDFQAMRNQIEKSSLQSKVDQPSAPEKGGVANAAAEPIKFADAGRIALEQLRQARQA